MDAGARGRAARLRQGHRRALGDRGDGRQGRRRVARAEGGQAHPQGRGARVGEVGSRLLFAVDDDDEDVVEVDAAGAPTNQRLELVESVAGRAAGKEGWNSWHDEGAMLDGGLPAPVGPGARPSPTPSSRRSSAPCDWGTLDFYERRKASMDARLAQVAACSPTALAALVREAFDAHYGESGPRAVARARGRRAAADHGRVL